MTNIQIVLLIIGSGCLMTAGFLVGKTLMIRFLNKKYPQ